jgi:hypothetical protein
MIIDLKSEIKDSADLRLLNAFLGAMTGQRLLKARLSYGDELKLHFGEPQPAPHPRLASLQRGSWVLATRASRWEAALSRPGLVLDAGVFLSPPAPHTQTATPREMAEYADKLAGAEVGAARAVWSGDRTLAPGLQLVFTDGSHFTLLPDPSNLPDEGDDEPLADWELFTPYKTYLRVGPEPVWSNLRSDVVAGAG